MADPGWTPTRIRYEKAFERFTRTPRKRWGPPSRKPFLYSAERDVQKAIDRGEHVHQRRLNRKEICRVDVCSPDDL